MPIHFPSRKIRSLLFAVLFVGAGSPMYAQLFSNGTANNGNISTQKLISDSSKKKQNNTDDKVIISYFSISDSTKRGLDSSITAIHRNPLLPAFHTDLGNTGSASQSLLLSPDMSPSMQLGLPAIQPLLFKWNQVKFYNTTRPYTSIYYRNGTKADQIITLFHTQNITPGWNVSADYRKINSPGFYKLQKTNHDNFTLASNYLSPNHRYRIQSAFLYNKIQQDENGGIDSYDYLYSAAYNDKRLVPVYYENATTSRSSVTNYFRNASFQFQQQYYFGKKDSVLNIDSTEKEYRFTPVFYLKHLLYTQHNYYRYKDVAPDSIDYQSFLQNDFVFGDSLFSKNFHTQIGNAFSVNGDIRFRQKVMQAEIGYGLEIEHIKNMNLNRQFYNNFVFANIKKPRQSESEWLYDAHIQLYFTGNAIGNFLIQAEAGRSMGDKTGTAIVGFRQCLQTAPYLLSHYATNYFEQKIEFEKQSISHLYVAYQNTNYHTSIKLNYYLLGNYLYRDSSLKTLQYGPVLPITQLELNKTFQYKTIVLDNQILLQISKAAAPIQLPLWSSVHRIAYQNKILKRKLLMATGVELRYNTPYFANNYAPMYFSFVTQYQNKIRNIPEVSYFFNFKVKRFRAAVAFDQLQQIFTRNNINFPTYAAQNFAIRFALQWAFVN